jgi:hypothetical protein
MVLKLSSFARLDGRGRLSPHGSFLARPGLPRSVSTLGAGLAVRAGLGVEAFVGEAKAFDRRAANDVRVDDLIDVGFGDVAVPDGFGIHDDGGTVFALVEASGLIGANAAFDSALSQLLLKYLLQTGLGEGIAGSAGMSRRALVSTDENVMFECRHAVWIFLCLTLSLSYSFLVSS